MELSKTEAIFRKEMHEKLENDFNEFVCYPLIPQHYYKIFFLST